LQRRAGSATASPPDRLVVELPTLAAADVLRLRLLISTTGRLDFVPFGQTPMETGQTVDLAANPPLFSGDPVAGASLGTNQTGGPTVDITLKPAGAKRFADYTAAHVGDFFVIALGGRVLTAPVIREAIRGGEVRISLNGTDGDPVAAAQNLATVLRFGQLPFPLHEIDAAQVTPAP
jgi:preprotein translocase subunit SecD